MQITVLGAGYMGSAMATVAVARGHRVRLWGTWLDDELLEPVERGGLHPRLKLPLTGMEHLRAPRLAEALQGAELVIHGISSVGALAVMEKARAFLPDVPIVSVTKGFLESHAGTRGPHMDRIDVVLAEAAGRPLRFVHASGPAKAMEISRGVLTWMVFASQNEQDARLCADALGGDHLQVGVSTDIAGAEICSALKNAYATGIGIWDGLVGIDAHDARAACFAQSIVEMRRLVLAGGGRDDTVHGAPGIGDLHVTAAGGRNRVFGERIGKGRPASEVAAEMLASGELTEGYAAIATAWRWAHEQGVTDLPFLRMLHDVVWQDMPVAQAVTQLRFV
ncbi:MAG TPA: NAD(P)H-dependent glycerol-3-phosphate dehydrogenase [Polyangiaceae bacterium]|nr:NAD(P)H-dependent glycerol-3-phosphate dehydrogenase [Polyangiaceae bacterium]